ncbi:MAG: hypothetical protein ACJAU1_000928 [Psychromonas sp.]|jgi:hypothetical protein
MIFCRLHQETWLLALCTELFKFNEITTRLLSDLMVHFETD